MIKFILASKSPRRCEILKQYGFTFRIVESNANEKHLTSELTEKEIIENIKYNSALKAYSVWCENKSEVIVSADTTVVKNNVCLNKPHNVNEAFLYLKSLSNSSHKVFTAITVCADNYKKTEIFETIVYFRHLSDDEIYNYIDKFNPLDKAGAYGIQDFISAENADNPPPESFVSKIVGSYYNVMGICPIGLDKMLENYRVWAVGTFNL